VRGGQELLFLAGDGLTVMAVDVRTSPGFQSDAPKELFRLRQDHVAMDFAPDGQRILVAAPAGQARSATITLELNWTAALKKAMNRD